MSILNILESSDEGLAYLYNPHTTQPEDSEKEDLKSPEDSEKEDSETE